MGYLKTILPCLLLIGCHTAAAEEIAQYPFLASYVQQLKDSTSAEDLRAITAMAESELILLHHGYGTGIRNRWIHGNRDPELIQYFRGIGINEPDEASMVIIEALWIDLNSRLSPAERTAINTKRQVVARKRASYESAEFELEDQLTKTQTAIERCYMDYGLPAKNNPTLRQPFSRLLVNKSGGIRKILYFDGASRKLRSCVSKIVASFVFSPFQDDKFITLYILNFPSACRVAERDTMHN